MQRLWSTVPGRLSSNSALSCYGLFAPLALWRLCLSTTFGSVPRELPGFWGSTVFRLVPIYWKGSVKTTTSCWRVWKCSLMHTSSQELIYFVNGCICHENWQNFWNNLFKKCIKSSIYKWRMINIKFYSALGLWKQRYGAWLWKIRRRWWWWNVWWWWR